MSLLVIGSIAFDSVKTPFGEVEKVLGGAAVYASVSASFFNSVKLVGVVGQDFPKSDLDFLKSRRIDTKGLSVQDGETFFWRGEYGENMNEAKTIETELNVFSNFNPVLPEDYKNSEYVFLANIDPDIQMNILKQIKSPKLVALDTMNLWIDIKKKKLLDVISQVDILFINDTEIKQLTGQFNVIKAAKEIFKYGLDYVVIKRGEYGVIFLEQDQIFTLPAFPLECVRDTTGAGDSFAGGFMGYISNIGEISHESIRKASVVGTVMSSLNVEDFSLNQFKRINNDDILQRLKDFKKVLFFDDIVF